MCDDRACKMARLPKTINEDDLSALIKTSCQLMMRLMFLMSALKNMSI